MYSDRAFVEKRLKQQKLLANHVKIFNKSINRVFAFLLSVLFFIIAWSFAFSFIIRIHSSYFIGPIIDFFILFFLTSMPFFISHCFSHIFMKELKSHIGVQELAGYLGEKVTPKCNLMNESLEVTGIDWEYQCVRLDDMILSFEDFNNKYKLQK